MLHVRQIDHIVIRAADIKRMVSFYRDVICLPVEKVQEDLGLWQLRAGTTLVDLVDIHGKIGGETRPDHESPNMDHFCLQVEPWDEDSIEAHLIANGVDFDDPAERYGATGTGPSIYLRDPEGNTVELKGPATEAPIATGG